MVRCVLFDIDGTLLLGADSGHRQAYISALRQVYGLEADPYEGTHNRGHTDTAILVSTLRAHNIPEEIIWKRLPQAFRHKSSYFAASLFNHLPWPRVAPGALALLEQIKKSGVALGIITGNEKRIARIKLQKIGLNAYFRPIWGAFGEEHYERAQLSQMLWPRLKQMIPDITPAQVLMVGDTPLDIAAAKIIDCHSWVITTGKYSREILERENPCLLTVNLESLTWQEIVARISACDKHALKPHPTQGPMALPTLST